MKPNTIYTKNILEGMKELPDNSIDCIVTSPPYWSLRDYGKKGQIGAEKSYEQYEANLLKVFDECLRVLKPTGTLWLNLGDVYVGGGAHKAEHKNSNSLKRRQVDSGASRKEAVTRPLDISGENPLQRKNLLQLGARVALAMQARGWVLRQENIWHKPNCMPESVKDRFTTDHEKIFMFSKVPTGYYFNQKAVEQQAKTSSIRRMNYEKFGGNNKARSGQYRMNKNNHEYSDREKEGKRNRRTVWEISVKPFKGAHFAVFPTDLAEVCVKAGCKKGGIVLDPFMGSGTTAIAALKNKMQYVGYEINPKYAKIAEKRIKESYKL